eukprot:gnl/MRDRNA2_/MRDRNA2_118114_c0_seq1.p1 gnl/MRDRNA2_/MRDRNA2_118114_c0~~gnl/MRDRNA2_/MRDRNA2_118114_c0_seq1.p1  ORF type:complete len:237 (+),score=28.08 gnl/MRDRNA2_/MRDRNA2_118114_c0_seq1:81-791(+)
MVASHIGVSKSQLFSLLIISMLLSRTVLAEDSEDDVDDRNDSNFQSHEGEKEESHRSDSILPFVILIIPGVLVLLCCVVVAYVRYGAPYFDEKVHAKRKKLEKLEVSQKLDAEIPATVYGKGDGFHDVHEGNDEVCCICLEELRGTIVRKLSCSHVLHQRCFDLWCLHLSESHNNSVVSTQKPDESSWACPLCKHPALPIVGPEGRFTEATQSSSWNHERHSAIVVHQNTAAPDII